MSPASRQSGKAISHAPGLVVLYDGQCRLCSGTAGRLRRLDRHQHLELIDLHDPGVAQRFPGMDLDRALQEIQAVDARGRVYSGVDAFARIGALLPGWRWVAWLPRLPGLHAIAVLTYRWVARNRYRWNRNACPEGTCFTSGRPR